MLVRVVTTLCSHQRTSGKALASGHPLELRFLDRRALTSGSKDITTIPALSMNYIVCNVSYLLVIDLKTGHSKVSNYLTDMCYDKYYTIIEYHVYSYNLFSSGDIHPDAKWRY